jgi:hypothetical protein
MGLTAIVTNAGRAALVNAANTGTRAVTIAQVGLSGTALAPEAGATVLPGQFKTIATLSGDVVADDTIHLIVRDESADVFTVRSLALYLADGTLFALYGQADVLLEKSAQALMLLAIDIRFEDVDASAITFGDTNFLNPPATTERQGVVELATVAEAQAGIDALRAHAAGRALGHPRVAAGAGRGGLRPRRGSARWPAGQLVHQHRRASRLCAVGPDQRRGRKRARCRSARWAGQQLFREHPGPAWFLSGPDGDRHRPEHWQCRQGRVERHQAESNCRYHRSGQSCDRCLARERLPSGQRLLAQSRRPGRLGPDNDGAGSGLDADLLDGRQASDFALLSGARFQGNGNGVAGSEDWIIFSLRNNQGSASAVGNTSWESVNENGITVTSIQSFLDPDGKSTIALVTTPPGSRTADRRQNAAYIRGPAAPRTFTAAGCSSTAIPSGGRTTTARAPGSMPICSMGSRAAGTRTSSGDWAMPRCNRERVSASGPMPSRWAGTAASCS